MKKSTAIRSSRLVGLALLVIALSGGGLATAHPYDPCHRNCQLEWLQAAGAAQEFYDACMISAGSNPDLIALCSLQTDAILIDAEVSFNSCLEAQQHCSCTGGGGAF